MNFDISTQLHPSKGPLTSQPVFIILVTSRFGTERFARVFCYSVSYFTLARDIFRPGSAEHSRTHPDQPQDTPEHPLERKISEVKLQRNKIISLLVTCYKTLSEE